MKKISVIMILLALFASASTFASRYSFRNISDDLKVGAIAVYRTNEMHITVRGINKVNYKRKVAITLLNENASSYRFPDIYYDEFDKVKGVKASVYDENGKLVEVLRSSDILDMSAVAGGSFHTDARVKTLLFPLMKYPYTIEYEYEIISNGILSYPTWAFQPAANVSVERSGVQYIVPHNLNVKFWEVFIPQGVDSLSQKDHIIYTWQMEDIPASKANPYGLKTYRSPKLYATPLEFELDGYKGRTDSWKSFGEWSRLLIDGRDELPESEVKRVKELVKDAKSEREKVKMIYEYMQSRTRYVNIALGIGGWQPAPAKEVSEKGFGDCKALSNYTMALLKAVGVKSYYTLVKAGRNENVNPDFVSNQFNHIILCVPQPNDTIWLECTDQTAPFNFLGQSTSGQHVLLITEQGGIMAKTPNFKKEQNIILNSGTIRINDLVTITYADIQTVFSGIYFEYSQAAYSRKSQEGMKESLNKRLDILSFDVDSASFSMNKTENPTSTLDYKLMIKNFGVENSNRLFFTPSFTKEDFLLNDPFSIRVSENTTESDSLTYVIPFGYKAEYLPSSVEKETKYGSYKFHLISEENKLIFIRNFTLKKGDYPIEEFNEFHAFINSIASKDRERVVLQKTNV
jgi:transglutaminase-like putative cysteine protease